MNKTNFSPQRGWPNYPHGSEVGGVGEVFDRADGALIEEKGI